MLCWQLRGVIVDAHVQAACKARLLLAGSSPLLAWPMHLTRSNALLPGQCIARGACSTLL